MGSRKQRNDSIGLCGRISAPPVPDRDMTGTPCLVMYIDVRRKSGRVDRLPVAFKIDAIDPDKFAHCRTAEDIDIRSLDKDFYAGRRVMVIGSLKTHNSRKCGRINLFVSAEWVTTADNIDDYNAVQLIGRLSKDPRYQIKRCPICEIIVKVWSGRKEISIIPVLTWYKTAMQAADYAYSQRIKVCGRLQSRVYYKDGQPYTTYEIAAYKTELLN